MAVLTWGASSTMIGNTQGGCFAATMTLAGCEARRYKKATTVVVDPFSGVTTERLNRAIASAAQQQSFRIEPLHLAEMEMGFGLRAVSAGRTLVFETGRWQEAVIDLEHAKATDENRKKVFADLAVIVSAGAPDENALAFVVTHPVQFFTGKELENLLAEEKPVVKEAEPG